MKSTFQITIVVLLFLSFYACNDKSDKALEQEEERRKVEILTDYGTIVLELYNETPLHRDNFIKVAEEGVYDSVLFHRVIQSFMIQGGDPDSKFAKPGDTLGNGGLDYKVPAEFNSKLFHKKGVLAAARDGNPERASSSTQFYIVQGKVFNDSLIDRAQVRINTWLAQHYYKKDPSSKHLLDSLNKAIEAENMAMYTKYNDSINNMAEVYTNFERYTIPESHREIYKTIGGTPHLDQNYTVYGEVVEGLEIVDSIAATATGAFDRPLTDVRIKGVRVID